MAGVRLMMVARTVRKRLNSVMTPNGLAGSMGLNGMSVLIAARRKYPEVTGVETHPKVLYWALANKRYDYESTREDMERMLCWTHAATLPTTNEHEWMLRDPHLPQDVGSLASGLLIYTRYRLGGANSSSPPAGQQTITGRNREDRVTSAASRRRRMRF